MKLSQHFTRAEFERSDLAARRGIDNRIPDELVPDAIETAEMAERIRDFLSAKAGRPVPIQITSGYRCQELNRLLGSRDSSDHRSAGALDIVAPEFGTPYQIAKALAPRIEDLQIGQLIHEFGAWVHVSRIKPAKAVNRVITISKAGVQLGIQEV